MGTVPATTTQQSSSGGWGDIMGLIGAGLNLWGQYKQSGATDSANAQNFAIQAARQQLLQAYLNQYMTPRDNPYSQLLMNALNGPARASLNGQNGGQTGGGIVIPPPETAIPFPQGVRSEGVTNWNPPVQTTPTTPTTPTGVTPPTGTPTEGWIPYKPGTTAVPVSTVAPPTSYVPPQTTPQVPSPVNTTPVSQPLVPNPQGGNMTPTGDIYNQFRGYVSPDGGTFGAAASQVAGATWDNVGSMLNMTPDQVAQMRQAAASAGISDPQTAYALRALSTVTGLPESQLIAGQSGTPTAASLWHLTSLMGGIGNQSQDAILAGLRSSDPLAREASARVVANQVASGDYSLARQLPAAEQSLVQNAFVSQGAGTPYASMYQQSWNQNVGAAPQTAPASASAYVPAVAPAAAPAATTPPVQYGGVDQAMLLEQYGMSPEQIDAFMSAMPVLNAPTTEQAIPYNGVRPVPTTPIPAGTAPVPTGTPAPTPTPTPTGSMGLNQEVVNQLAMTAPVNIPNATYPTQSLAGGFFAPESLQTYLMAAQQGQAPLAQAAQVQLPANFMQSLDQLKAPTVSATNATVTGTQGFNSGQDPLMQAARRDLNYVQDPSLQFNGGGRYDQSGLFGALDQQAQRSLDQQIAQLQGSAGSLGQRFGTAMNQNEGRLRADFLTNLNAQKQQLGMQAFESAAGRDLQAQQMGLTREQAANQQMLSGTSQNVNAAQALQSGYNQAAQLGTNVSISNQQAALQAALANATNSLQGGTKGIDAQLQAALANAGYAQQTNQSNQSSQLQTMLANLQYGNQANQYNAQAATATNLGNVNQQTNYNSWLTNILGQASGMQNSWGSANTSLLGILAGLSVPQVQPSTSGQVAQSAGQLAMLPWLLGQT